MRSGRAVDQAHSRARRRGRAAARIIGLLVACGGLAALALTISPAAPAASGSAPAAAAASGSALAGPAASGSALAAPAASGPGPSVTMSITFGENTSCSCVSGGSMGLNATVSGAPAGQPVSVQYQYSPADQNQWSPIPSQDLVSGFGNSATFSTNNGDVNDGDYDLEAVATIGSGSSQTTVTSPPVRDVIVDNNSTVLTETAPNVLHGTVTLRTTVYQPSSVGNPSQVIYQWSPAGTENWSDIATVNAPDPNNPPALTSIKVSTGCTGGAPAGVACANIPDGRVDLRVTATDQNGDSFVGLPVRNLLVDNSPPVSSLSVPASPLGGTVTLQATATDAGTGVASVAFQVSPAGSGQWMTLGEDGSSPYSLTFDTRQLADGAYDFRVVATDAVGNSAPSPVVGGVRVSNPGKATYGNFQITNYLVPATNVKLLGEIANSPVHETWAYGQTTAPAATIHGSQMTFGVSPEPVLLRYTDPTGWQIIDVLRCGAVPDPGVGCNAAGAAFPAQSTAKLSGQLTPSGEGWIVLTQPGGGGTNTVAMFHKSAGSDQFVLDPAASQAVEPLLVSTDNSSPGAQVPTVFASPGQIKLGQNSDGSTYGLLVAPEQPSVPQLEPSTNGQTVSVATELRYGVLQNTACDNGLTPPPCWEVKTAPLPAGFTARQSNEEVSLMVADPTGSGSMWAALSSTLPQPLMLGHLTNSGWNYSPTGLDVLDLTGSAATTRPQVYATAIGADPTGVWLNAQVSPSVGTGGPLVAHFDQASTTVDGVWCSVIALSSGCTNSLDANHPAAVPQAVFQGTDGSTVAEALGQGGLGGFVDLYSHGAWAQVPAPGFSGGPGQALFTSPNDGWIVGTYSIGRISAQPPPASLAVWPQPNRSTLLSVALPPAGAGIATSGALAVGLSGAALQYDATNGWLVTPTPPKAEHIALRGVAFDGPGRAVAVGDLGTILNWNGSSWSSDSQSNSLTVAQLNAVAFAPDGDGWAVGTFGTILHWNGSTWSSEQIDANDAGENITSVSVAGNGDVLAVAGGNLIERSPNGTWQQVTSLPSPAPPAGSLRVVSALPDGGAVAAGNSVLMTRVNGSSHWEYSAQPIAGSAVALSAFRDSTTGAVEAFVSLSPPSSSAQSSSFPSGAGDLVVAGSGGLVDLSRDQYPAASTGEEGATVPDPVLAVAASANGDSAWGVGGYAGTVTPDGLGINKPLQARSPAWQTASIWRYDAGGSRQSTAQSPALLSIPAKPKTVSFGFFSSAECVDECASARDAQPDVNLSAATSQIASFAREPGGPAFAVLGGNAVGPLDGNARNAGDGAIDLADLSKYLSPLGSVPLYAAYGPLDGVPTSSDGALPWAEAFGAAPAPFGSGSFPNGVGNAASGGADGSVHRYYAFDASQNGGVVRVIVLDNSAGSLDASEPGQTAWLDSQLAAANAAQQPIVAFTAEPLDGSTQGAAGDGAAVAGKLAAAGVLAVFTSNTDQVDREVTIHAGGSTLTEYQGATLGYQQSSNNGVLWYFASVDTATRQVTVQAIPVIESLALEPLAGLSVSRSSTLSFQAIGRRPPGTLATIASSAFPFTAGIDNYVSIPATPKCTGCLTPSYSFSSSDPTIGDFVAPSAPGSLLPALDPSGHPIPSSTSGLFCAYNSGSTTVSVTSGQLTASQVVTVAPGQIGSPCGTVFRSGVQKTVVVPQQQLVSSQPAPGSTGAPVTPPTQNGGAIAAKIHSIVPPPPPAVAVPAALPAPVHARTPPKLPVPISPPQAPLAQSFLNPSSNVNFPVSAAIVPPITPPATPIPPGGATASSAVKREEKARKHASQSAYTIRPAGSSADNWFIPAVAAGGLAAVILVAIGLGQNFPGGSPALLWNAAEADRVRRRRGGWPR